MGKEVTDLITEQRSLLCPKGQLCPLLWMLPHVFFPWDALYRTTSITSLLSHSRKGIFSSFLAALFFSGLLRIQEQLRLEVRIVKMLVGKSNHFRYMKIQKESTENFHSKELRIKRSRVHFRRVTESQSEPSRIAPHDIEKKSVVTFVFTVVTEFWERQYSCD